MPQSLGVQSVLLDNGFTGTIYPVWGFDQLPLELIASLCVEYNAEIDRGRSFSETHHLSLTAFEQHWFSGVSGVMVAGDNQQLTIEDFSVLNSSAFLGSFCIYPAYPGRSSHIATANFLVKSRFRRRGVGLAMTQCFMRWATQLGYDYALFNFVYDCNIGACRILHKLNFKILTTIQGAGILKGFPHPVDAFLFGRPLAGTKTKPLGASNAIRGASGPSVAKSAVSDSRVGTPLDSALNSTPLNDDPNNTPLDGDPNSTTLPGTSQTESSLGDSSLGDTPHTFETHSTTNAAISNSANNQSLLSRPSIHQHHTPEFRNLVHYLTHARYPEGLSRAEHSRIRSRCRYYEIRNHVLVYKRSGAVVVSDPNEQFRIAQYFHNQNHQGINKLVSLVLSQYYWLGVRESIMKAIRECAVCKQSETSKKRVNLGLNLPANAPVNGDATSSPNAVGMLADSPGVNRNDQLSDYRGGTKTLAAEYPKLIGEPADTEKIIYLRPENEDSDYIPSDEAYDMGLNGRHQEFLDDENNLFRDDDDGEWVGDDCEEDHDDDDDDDENMEDDDEDYDENDGDIEDG